MMGVVATMVFMLRRLATDCGVTLCTQRWTRVEPALRRQTRAAVVTCWRLDRFRQSTLAGGLPT